MAASRSPKQGLRLPLPAAFGADPTGARMARIRRSPHFRDGVFQNPGGTARTRPSGSARDFARVYFDKESRRSRAPRGPVPVHATTLADLARPPATGLRLTWMGHSSVLAEIDGQRVLFDPVWGERCSPFPFAGPKRLHPVPVPSASLGPVDVVVISHDHYDHLDLPTIKALAGTDTLFAVPLGVGAHLEHWGVSADRLRELDWHESTRVGGLTLTATPARHFCGRGLRNTQHTLWASWVVASEEHRVYHSGDTGYFDGFRDNRRRARPVRRDDDPAGGVRRVLAGHPHDARGRRARPPGPSAGPAGRCPAADPLGDLQPGAARVGGAGGVDQGRGRGSRPGGGVPAAGGAVRAGGEAAGGAVVAGGVGPDRAPVAPSPGHRGCSRDEQG